MCCQHLQTSGWERYGSAKVLQPVKINLLILFLQHLQMLCDTNSKRGTSTTVPLSLRRGWALFGGPHSMYMYIHGNVKKWDDVIVRRVKF
jgi:hypothetical protein